MVSLKPILLFIFIPFLILWGTIHSIKKIKSPQNKIILTITVVVFTVGLGYNINNYFLKNRPKYQIAHLVERLKVFHTQHPEHPVPNSKYTLGEINYSLLNLVKNTPKAINVTFFRPYLWEANNLPTLIAATESLMLLIFAIMVILHYLKNHSTKNLINNETALMLLFSVVYGGIAGISSSNFGALTRHKIPAVFFFLLALIILYTRSEHQKNTKTYRS